jgi:chitin disaccharide deacetylase
MPGTVTKHNFQVKARAGIGAGKIYPQISRMARIGRIGSSFFPYSCYPCHPWFPVSFNQKARPYESNSSERRAVPPTNVGSCSLDPERMRNLVGLSQASTMPRVKLNCSNIELFTFVAMIAAAVLLPGPSVDAQGVSSTAVTGSGKAADQSNKPEKVWPAGSTPPRLVVRADDMGFSHAGNEAILKCYKTGIVTSVEVIVPSPWFPEAVKMLTENPGADAGIHLALSSEWDNIKWRPVSDSPSLRDGDGYFFPMIFPNKNYPGRALAENKWRIEDVEKELRAQIELGLKHLPRISHLSAHMGCTSMSPEIKVLAKRLATEYKIPIGPDQNFSGAGYVGPHRTSQEKIESFIRMLESLQAGKTYMFVDHPGVDSPELRAIHHIGYEDVAADRQGVTDTFTSARVRDAIRFNGIRLIGYKDVIVPQR